MKKLFFSSYNRYSHRLGIMFSELQESIDEGVHENILMVCDGSFNICGHNSSSKRSICYLCKENLKNNKDKIQGDFRTVLIQDILTENAWRETIEFYSQDIQINNELKYEDYELGQSIVAAYISDTKDIFLENAANNPYLNKVKENTLALYLSLKEYLKKEQIEHVTLFNGRWDYYRATLAAARNLGIIVKVVEMLRPGGYLIELENNVPHDIQGIKDLILGSWERSDLPEETKIELGSRFFDIKRDRKVINDRVYTTHQEDGRLPNGFDRSEKNIVVFTSSNHEYAAAGYKHHLFNDQNDGIQFVIDTVVNSGEDIKVYIRMHPNLKGLDYDYINEIYEMAEKYNDVYVIRPEDAIDSYSILDNAWKVVVFGSTIGIETTYARKPCILLNQAFYRLLDIAWDPSDLNELRGMLLKEIGPKPILNAVKYGFHVLHGGVKSKYFENKSLTEHYFKGEPIYQFTLKQRVVNKLLKFFE